MTASGYPVVFGFATFTGNARYFFGWQMDVFCETALVPCNDQVPVLQEERGDNFSRTVASCGTIIIKWAVIT